MTKLEYFKAAALALAVSLSYATPAAAQAKLLQKLEQKLGLQPKAGATTGAQGAEGSPNRRQEWLLPTADQITMSRAVLFRPVGKGPFRLALIAHDSPSTRQERAKMPQPEYPALAAALVARGFAVVVPQRLGHGKTGGPYLEDPEGCEVGEYALSAQATGESITAALNFVRAQPFIRKDASVIVGHGAGGWGALSLADRSVKGVSAIVVFAPGRGGRKDNRAGAVCASDKLVAAATDFGDGAKTPVTWIVAQNDSYFTPEFSKQMVDAFAEKGDKVDFQVVAPYGQGGQDGHALAETTDEPLMEQLLAGVKALQPPTPPTQGVATKPKP